MHVNVLSCVASTLQAGQRDDAGGQDFLQHPLDFDLPLVGIWILGSWTKGAAASDLGDETKACLLHVVISPIMFYLCSFKT